MKKLTIFFVLLVAIQSLKAQTTFLPGDIVIVGINANTGGGTDQISFVSFKNITSGTVFDITDNSYERVNSGQFGDNEGTVRITRTGTTITAGTVFTLQFSSYLGITPDNNWNFTSLNGSSTFNMNTSGDQLYIFQGGNWNNPSGTHDATYDGGKMIFAFNTKSVWAADGTTQQANKFPFYECFHVNPTAASDWVKYDGALSAADQRTWINRINNPSNWETYTSSNNYNNNGNDYIGGFNLNITSGGYNEGTWVGNVSTNWFDCANWQSMLVPNKQTNVVVGNVAQRDVFVDFSAQFSDQYTDTANCNNIDINSRKLAIKNTRLSILKTHGNLIIGTNGELDMSDGNNSTIDGQLYLYGNFTNSRNDETWFKEGGSIVRLIGSGNQIISSAAQTEAFYDLEINKPSGIVTLQSTIEVDKNGEMDGGILYLTKGKINANFNEIIISNDNEEGVYDYSEQSYVYGGFLKRQIKAGVKYDFPVGTASNYQLATVDLGSNVTFSGSNPYLSGKFISPNSGTVPNQLVENSIDYTDLLNAGYWDLSPNVSLTAGSYDITLNETGFTNGGSTSYTTVKRNDVSSAWNFPGNEDFFTETSTVISAKRTDISSFSHHAIVRASTLPFATIIETNFSVCIGSDTSFSINGTPNATVVYTVNGTNQSVVLDNNGNALITTGTISGNVTVNLVNITSTTNEVNTLSDNIVISATTLDDATFGYGFTTYCVTSQNSIPTISGVSGGVFSATNGLTINSSTGEIDFSSADLDTYTITYQTLGNCANSSSVTVSVTNAAVADFSYLQYSYCKNESLIVPTLASGAVSGIYSSSSGLSINTTTGEISIQNSDSGSYSIVNLIEANQGCPIVTDTFLLTIHNLPTVDAGTNQSICLGSNVTLSGNGAVNYTWNNGISNGVSFFPTTLDTIIYKVEGVDANGCKNTDSLQIIVIAVPISNAGFDQIVCTNEVSLIGESNNLQGVNWLDENNNLLSTSINYHTTINTDSKFILKANNNNQCFSFDTVFVKFSKVEASLNTSITEGMIPLNVIFSNSTTNATNYSWNFGDISPLSTEQNPVYTYNAIGEFMVTLTASNEQCIDTAITKIITTGSSYLTLPNVFTPNGDGINDVFIPDYFAIAYYKLEVFNRWGAKIFETDNIKNGWNGTDASSGTYFYILHAKGLDTKEYHQNGWTSLIK